MELHRYLYGTRADGAYSEIARSDNLYDFLISEIGANSVRNVMDRVVGAFHTFQRLSDYFQYTKKEKPVTISYAPLYLDVFPGMPTDILPLSAIGVSGPENRGNEGPWAVGEGEGRDTSFCQLEMFHCKDLYQDNDFNHLDILFGTSALSDVEIKQIRREEKSLDDVVHPRIVAPNMRDMDKNHVFSAVDALLSGKDVVIHLESGVTFNYRSKEVLMQIYSMLPPQYAVGLGYSSYQAPKNIAALRRKWSMRIFVVPGEEPLTADIPSEMVTIDFSARIEEKKDSLWECLQTWYDMPWNRRLMALRTLFADIGRGNITRDDFVRTSTEYKKALGELPGWRKRYPKGSISNLRELKAAYDDFGKWSLLTDGQEIFRNRISYMLRQGVSISGLIAEACERSKHEENAILKAECEKLYKFGSKFSTLDVQKLDGLYDKFYQDREASVVNAAVREEQVKHAAVVKAKETEIVSLKADHKKELKEKDDQLAKQNSDHDAEKIRIQGEHQAEITRLETAHQMELGKKDQEITNLNEQHKVDLGKKDQEITDLKVQHKADVERKDQEMIDLNVRHKAALDKKDQEMIGLNAQHQVALGKKDQEIRNLQGTYEAEKEILNQKLKDVEKDASNKEQTIENLRNELGTANETERTLRRENVSLAADLESERKQTKKLNRDLDDWKKRERELSKREDDLSSEQEALEKKIEKLERIKKNVRNKLSVPLVAGVVGLVIGALIVGAIWFVVGLTGTEPQPTIPVTTETTETQFTTAPTTAPTTVPTTAPTEPPADLTDWTAQSTVDEIQVRIPQLQTVITGDQLPLWLTDLDNSYGNALALLSVNQLELDGENGGFAVLYERIEEQEVADPEKTGATEATEETETTNEETVPTEPTVADFIDSTEPTETATFVMSVRMIYTSADYVIAVYGDGDTAVAALEVLKQIQADALELHDIQPDEITMEMVDGEQKTDISALFEKLELAEDWWRSITAIHSDENACLDVSVALGVEQLPMVCISAAEDMYCVFDFQGDYVQAQALADSLKDGQSTVVDGYVLVKIALTMEQN